MSVLALNYSELSLSIKNANKAADQARDYGDTIKKTICKKISSLPGGSTNNTSNADWFAQKKIAALAEKADRLDTFASKLGAFASNVEDTDTYVYHRFQSLSSEFKRQNDMKVNPVTEFFVTLVTGVVNASDFCRWVKDTYNKIADFHNSISDAIKYWYICEGGKNVAKRGSSISALILASLKLSIKASIDKEIEKGARATSDTLDYLGTKFAFEKPFVIPVVQTEVKVGISQTQIMSENGVVVGNEGVEINGKFASVNVEEEAQSVTLTTKIGRVGINTNGEITFKTTKMGSKDYNVQGSASTGPSQLSYGYITNTPFYNMELSGSQNLKGFSYTHEQAISTNPEMYNGLKSSYKIEVTRYPLKEAQAVATVAAVVGIIVLAPVVVPVLGTVKGTAIIGAILGILGKGTPVYGHEEINIEENRTKDNSDEKKSSN